jgi:hypothetical protein
MGLPGRTRSDSEARMQKELRMEAERANKVAKRETKAALAKAEGLKTVAARQSSQRSLAFLDFVTLSLTPFGLLGHLGEFASEHGHLRVGAPKL